MRSALKLSLVLSLLGAVVFLASPAHAQSQTLTGWFSMTITDYLPESGRAPKISYGLTDDQGQYHELLLDPALMKPLGGPVALNRKRVTVVGEWESVGPDASAQFWVHSIRLASSAGKKTTPEGAYQALQAPSQEAVTGSQAWVTILCRFGDATDVTPHPVSYYEGFLGASEPGLEHYWNEVSYGNIPDLRGSIVVGWYNLPRPRSYYVYDKDGDGEEESDGRRMREDCTAAADADVFFPDFWGINLVYNGKLERDVGGFVSVRGPNILLTKDGQQQFYSVTHLSAQGAESQATWAHEMGHAFGLMHSSGPYGQDDPRASPTTYDSQWDVMSGGRSLDPHPDYGRIGVHTIAYHKDFLGWIPPRSSLKNTGGAG